MRIYIMYMENKIQKNVLGENLELCSKNPLTGWYRDGCCCLLYTSDAADE